MKVKCKIAGVTIDHKDMTKYPIESPEIKLKIISEINPEILKILGNASIESSYIEIDLNDIRNHRNYFV